MNNTITPDDDDDIDELWYYAVWIVIGLGILSVLCVFTTVCSFVFKIVGG